MCCLWLEKDSLGLIKPALPKHVLLGAEKHRFSFIGVFFKGHLIPLDVVVVFLFITYLEGHVFFLQWVRCLHGSNTLWKKYSIISSPLVSSTFLYLTNPISLTFRKTYSLHAFIHSFHEYLLRTVYIIRLLLQTLTTLIFSAPITLRAKQRSHFLSSSV